MNIPDVITVLKNNVAVTQPVGNEILVAMSVAASKANADRAEAALAEIQLIAEEAPEAPGITARALKSANLSDLTDPSAARSNIGALADDGSNPGPGFLSNINAAVAPVLNRAALSALPVDGLVDGSVRNTLCSVSVNRGGGLTYVWDAASTLTPDGYLFIRPDSAPTSGRWIADVLEFVDARLFDVHPANDPAVNGTNLQTAINLTRGKTLVIPRFGDGQRIRFSGKIHISTVAGNGRDPDTEANRPISIMGEGGPDGDGGFSGTTLQWEGASGNAWEIHNLSAGDSADQSIHLRNFALVGREVDQGPIENSALLELIRCNNSTLIENIWFIAPRDKALRAEHCYGAKIRDCVALRTGGDCYEIADRSNGLQLLSVKAIGCGVIKPGSANFRVHSGTSHILGAGYPPLAPSMIDCDASYAGAYAKRAINKANGSLVSITVLGSTHTVSAPGHAFNEGESVVVRGAIAVPALNTGAFSVAVENVTSGGFEFTRGGVTAGTYTDATLKIHPENFGVLGEEAVGMKMHGLLVESCYGPNAYLKEGFNDWELTGGYSQDGWIIVEGKRGRIGGYNNFRYEPGWTGGLYMNFAPSDYRVDVGWNVGFIDKSEGGTQGVPAFVHPDIFMQGGQYFGPTPPGSGTWPRGIHIKNSLPASGQPTGFASSVAGTPGAWLNEGNFA